MKFSRWLAVSAATLLVWCINAESAWSLTEQQLNDLTTSVKEMCESPGNVGEYFKIEGEADAGVILKMFGGKLEGKITKEKWSGVQRIRENETDPLLCRIQTLGILAPYMSGSDPRPPEFKIYAQLGPYSLGSPSFSVFLNSRDNGEFYKIESVYLSKDNDEMTNVNNSDYILSTEIMGYSSVVLNVRPITQTSTLTIKACSKNCEHEDKLEIEINPKKIIVNQVKSLISDSGSTTIQNYPTSNFSIMAAPFLMFPEAFERICYRILENGLCENIPLREDRRTFSNVNGSGSIVDNQFPQIKKSNSYYFDFYFVDGSFMKNVIFRPFN